MLEEVGLSKTILNVQPYVKKVVLEFYANLSKNMSNAVYDDDFLAYVYGHLFAFPPHEINRYLNHVPYVESMVSLYMNVVSSEFTKGMVRTWVGKSVLRASALTHKCSIMHKIGRKNWVPTTNHSKVSMERVN